MLCPAAVNDSSERALNHLVITGAAFSQTEIEKPTPAATGVSWEGSSLGRQLSSLKAFLQGSIPARLKPLLAPRGFMSLSHQPTDFWRCGLSTWGSPAIFSREPGDQGLPQQEAPARYTVSPWGTKSPFQHPKQPQGPENIPLPSPKLLRQVRRCQMR